MPDQQIIEAVERLRAGGLVAFPTETVYGLGADARNPLAVRRIYATKGRPPGHPIIVHLPAGSDPGAWAMWGPRAQDLATAFWPGPLTLVLPRAPGVLDEVTGGLDTVGIRVPSHPVAQALLGSFGGGLAAPSANRFGRVSPTSAAHVRAELDEAVMVLDGGSCEVGIESTIVDLTGVEPALLRPGGVAPGDIAAIVGPLTSGTTPAPGTLPQHYAPCTALHVSDEPDLEAQRLRSQGLRVEVVLAGPAADHAQRLYAELRRLDGLGVDVLVAERSPHGGLGLAINDRLERAASGSPSFQQTDSAEKNTE